MALSLGRRRLHISTVDRGFYCGFNPVVSVTVKVLMLALAAILLMFPNISGSILAAATKTTLSLFTSWYVYLTGSLVVVVAVLIILPVSGRLRLGPQTSRPEISTWAWLSMMFCAGIGTGLLVFSVSEPLSHFAVNPTLLAGQVEAGSTEAAAVALQFTFLHWGVTAWSGYAIIGVALGLACHRFGQPLTMRSAVAPLFGKRLEGPIGHGIDILAVLAIVTGITTTIVHGLEQICTGLAQLTGLAFFADERGDATLNALLTALVVCVAIAIASITSGVDRGVKWTSQLGVLLGFCFLVLFLVFGIGWDAVQLFVQATQRYALELPVMSFSVHLPSEVSGVARDWQETWSVLYFAWTIAFAPFVGLFLARVSRGRTVREFLLGAVLTPTLMCVGWFTVIGGTALMMEIDGIAQGHLIATEHAFRIYETVNLMASGGLATLIKFLLVLLFLILTVASSTAAIITIKSIGCAGAPEGESKLHCALWAVSIAALTGAIVSMGGIEAIRNLMIVGALPFSLIVALMVPGIFLMIGHRYRRTARVRA